jgi:PAS domain S-box-containing protein
VTPTAHRLARTLRGIAATLLHPGASLLGRLAGAYSALILLVVVVVAGVAYWRARASLETAILDRLRAVAVVKEGELAFWIDEQRGDLVFIAGVPTVRKSAARLAGFPAPPEALDAAGIAALFDSARAVTLDMAEVFLLAARGGRVLASTDPAHVGTYRVSELFFTRGRHETFVQNVYPSPETGRPTLTVATPVRAPDGRTVAVLAGHLDLSRVDLILKERTGLGATGEAYLVTALNDFVSAERFGRAEARRGVHTDGVRQALAGRNGVGVYRNYRGVEVLGAYRWIRARELALLAETHAEEAFAPAQQLFWTILVIGLAASALALWGAWVTARRVATPVLAVAGAAARVARGDFDAVAPVTTQDEVGVLAGTFNEMTARLRTVYGDLSRQVDETGRANRALVESQTLLRALVDNTANLIAVLDREGRFLLVNRRFEDAVGVGRESARGRTPSEVLAPDLAFLLDAAAHAALRGEPVVERDGDIEVRGARTHYHFVVFPLTEGDRPPFGVGIVGLDLTERVRAEDERRRLEAGVQQAQKLESLGLLAGGIAHDFNNILTAIVGGASMALAEMPPSSPVRTDLEQVIAAAERAAKLTRQMLAYAGRASFAIETFDLNVVIREMAELIAVSVPKQVRLVHDPAAPLPPIRGDRTQVSQIVLNLITNAAEATADRGGTVTIATRPRDRGALDLDAFRFPPAGDASAFVELSVRDDGAGMAPETLERMFDPFYSTKGSGRGLGLAAVLGIVKRSGGTLRVTSAPGAGTAMTVLFPAVGEAARPVREEPRPRPAPHASGTVLLVDDEEALRRTTRRLLERAGFAVIEARDGLEGVERFREDAARISTVILDVTMPVMGGAEAFRRIREIAPAVPVVVSSGYDEQDTASAFTGPAVEFLQKPYRPDGLLDAMRRVGTTS